MPVRIEDRVNRAAAGQTSNGFHQRVGRAGGSAVDEHDAVRRGVRDDVGFAGDLQDEQIVSEAQRARTFRRRLRRRLFPFFPRLAAVLLGEVGFLLLRARAQSPRPRGWS